MEYFTKNKYIPTLSHSCNYEFNKETYSAFLKEWRTLHNEMVITQKIEKKLSRDSLDSVTRSRYQENISYRKLYLTNLYEIRVNMKDLYKESLKEVEYV